MNADPRRERPVVLRTLLGATLLICLSTGALAQTAKIEGVSVTFSTSLAKTSNSEASAAENCTGPGDIGDGGFNVQAGAPVVFASTVTASPGILFVPGSCVVTGAGGGTCLILNPTTLTYNNPALLGFVSITYKTLITDVTPGTQLCQTINFSVNGTPASLPLTCFATTCPAVGPGILPAAISPPSDQKAGSVLLFNFYTSSAASPGQQNTRFNITNTDPERGTAVHLFFIDGNTCSVADRYICLSPSQTMSFLASEQDPTTSGFLLAVAVEGSTGCPRYFNHLIGDAFVKSTLYNANLVAEAVSALGLVAPVCDTNSVTTLLRFDGVNYGQLSRVLATSSIPSRLDGNGTLLVINRISGDLSTTNLTVGTLFGILYNDAEQPHSFQAPGGCQLRLELQNSSIRTTPRFDTVIPAGQSGWIKIYSPGDIGISGVQLTVNPGAGSSAGAFNQGHGLHKLTLTSAGFYTIPVFPPNC